MTSGQEIEESQIDLESARKWLHLAPGGLAVALPWIGPWGALLLCLGLLAFNLWIFPRLGSVRLWRTAEKARGEAPGIVFYPVALLLLAIAARGRLEVLAGGWGMLAFGDAAATLAGRRWGRRRLPWNRDKSWLGSLAFVAASWAAAALLVLWVAPGRYAPLEVLIAAGAAALCGAVAESLPWVLDDNLSVTLVGGAVLFAALEIAGSAQWTPAPAAAAGALAVGLLALAARAGGALDGAGAAVGLVLALAILVGGGPAAIGLLAIFVALGTASGRFRRRRTAAGQEPARGPRNALANGAVAAGCGLVAASSHADWPLLALGGALATAAADTVGGELGLALQGRTWRLSDLRRVSPGTNGGVSLAGTVATVSSAALIGVLGVLGGLFEPAGGLLVAGAGVAGATVDSLLGATLERRGLLDNEAVNFLATLTGAWFAAQTSLAWP